MIPGKNYYFYVASYFSKQLRYARVLSFYVFYFKVLFLVWIHPDSCNKVPHDKQIFYFFRFGGVWNFSIEVICEFEKIFFQKKLAPDVNVADENCALFNWRTFSFMQSRFRQKEVVGKKNFSAS